MASISSSSPQEGPLKSNMSIKEKAMSDHNLENGESDFAQGQVRRDLKARHIHMIAIAGMIGTGLFLSSGNVIAKAGPVGALFAYILMGAITSGISYSTGEISAFMPVSGGFVRHATKFISPAIGAATGWNFWYTMAVSAPAELSAAATLIDYWNSSISPAVWFTVFIVVIVCINFAGVRIYGESEVIFASMKIALIIGLILAGIIVDLGGGPDHDRIGFRYWKNPGPFHNYLVSGTTGNFLAFWSSLISAAYSYGNIQIVALAGTETQNPRKNIPNATKLTFWRVLTFYVLGIFVVGLLVPYNDENLAISTGTAQQSPFVIAFTRAGIKVLPSIINAVVLTSAFSSGSACIFLASRTIYGLAEEKQAPAIFLRTNRWGTPWVAVAASLIFTPLVYLSLGSSASVAFGWFVNITTVAGLIGWIVVEVSYLRFYYALKAQGISRDRLPYKSPFQPYMSWATLVAVFLVVFFSGFDVFFPGNWSPSSFLTCYVNIFIFAFLVIVAQIVYRTGIIPLSQIDLSEIELIEQEKSEHIGEAEKIRPWWRSCF